jgi:23S rRNA (uracil1939-C5)-methyltransferase
VFHVKQSYPVYKGQVLTVEITGYTSEGAGVARVEGLAVFVAGSIRGETVKIRIAHIGHTAAYGDIVEILTPSPERLKPRCPHASDCGGCVFWHMTYEEELRAKAQRVTDALNRIGGFDLPVVPITGSPDELYYRNKAQYPVAMGKKGPVAGFFRQRTHEVVPIDRCLIQHETADRVKAVITDWMHKHHVTAYNEQTRTGLVRHIYVRTGMATDQVLVCLVINGDGIPNQKGLVDNLLMNVDNIISITLNIHKKAGNAVLGDKFVHIYGPGYIEDVLCDLRFRLSPRSFYQVNRAQAQQLYAAAIRQAELTGTETALDLYCGTGTITLALSRHAKTVVGVEIIEQAIVDAKENALRNGIENAEFCCADASTAAADFAKKGVKPDVIVVDPPRKGLDETVIDAMVQMSPERIVYVSCDPATLARDCKRLCAKGYALTHAEAFDMFPRTAHVESVVQLRRHHETTPVIAREQRDRGNP